VAVVLAVRLHQHQEPQASLVKVAQAATVFNVAVAI
jgi:hypothetical protein